MKVAIPFWEGREGVSEEVKTLGEAPPSLNDQLPRTVKKIMIYGVFHSVTPRPRVSGSAPSSIAGKRVMVRMTRNTIYTLDEKLNFLIQDNYRADHVPCIIFPENTASTFCDW